MLSEPRIEFCPEQPYLAILAKVPTKSMGKTLPPLWEEVSGWMKAHEIAPGGAPFWQYRVINMGGTVQIEVGFPVSEAVEGNDRIIAGSFPAGRYATVVYTGPYKGKGLMMTTAEFLEWAKKNGVNWHAWDAEEGHTWASRTEFYLTDPAIESNPKKYQTELAFLTAEDTVV